MDDFTAKSQTFLKEFTSQPNATFHPHIEITDLRYRGAGRGIVATADIPPDTELFSIPRNYVITFENSDLYKKFPHIFFKNISSDLDEDEEDKPKAWLDLILVMIYDYLHYSTSKWRSYWDVLPSDINTLMFWSDQELAELQASHVRQRIGKEDANKLFNKHVIPLLNQFANIFYPTGSTRLSDQEVLHLAHQMGTLIMAYAFDLESNTESSSSSSDDEDEENDGWKVDKDPDYVAMGMVPMADMLNADAEFNAHLEHSEDRLTMKSLRQISRGEEVLNYYGPWPNSELLRRYGYTSDKHRRYDVVELTWNLIEKVILQELPTLDSKQPEVQSFDMEDAFILERDSGDPDDTGILNTEARFKNLPEGLLEQASILIAPRLNIPERASKRGPHDKKRLKKAFWQIMSKVIMEKINEYSTNLDDDMRLLDLPNIPARLRMAIDVRIGEKMLLVEAGELIKELLNQDEYKDLNIYQSDISGTTLESRNGKSNRLQKRGNVTEKSGNIPPTKKQKLSR